MSTVLTPARELAALVKAYWFIEDLPGKYAGHLIRTSPVPLAVLSVNLGRPNAAEDGGLVPGVSFLGLQSRSRAWHSCADTCFVMVMLTISGFVRLFPHSGAGSADRLIDLAAMTGDAAAQSLKSGIGPDLEPQQIVGFLDRWLIARMNSMRPLLGEKQIAAAHSVLSRGGTVEAAAETIEVSRRQLHRLFHRHLGVGPKHIADLERLHSSLRNVQSGRGDPVQGFSDQAHQIRSWRRRLGVTPGAYVRAGHTSLAGHFDKGGAGSGVAYYL